MNIRNIFKRKSKEIVAPARYSVQSDGRVQITTDDIGITLHVTMLVGAPLDADLNVTTRFSPEAARDLAKELLDAAG